MILPLNTQLQYILLSYISVYIYRTYTQLFSVPLTDSFIQPYTRDPFAKG
jgi:hypothetical protein